MLRLVLASGLTSESASSSGLGIDQAPLTIFLFGVMYFLKITDEKGVIPNWLSMWSNFCAGKMA